MGHLYLSANDFNKFKLIAFTTTTTTTTTTGSASLIGQWEHGEEAGRVENISQ